MSRKNHHCAVYQQQKEQAVLYCILWAYEKEKNTVGRISSSRRRQAPHSAPRHLYRKVRKNYVRICASLTQASIFLHQERVSSLGNAILKFQARFDDYKDMIYVQGTFINDVSRFLAIFDLPTYLVLLYNVPFLGLFWTPLPTLIRDVINGRSLGGITDYLRLNPQFFATQILIIIPSNNRLRFFVEIMVE